MTVPSSGDILILSQVAWKTGRLFSAGRTNAPLEFQVIEIEISSLAKALKLLAQIFCDESKSSLLQTAEKEIQDGISTILSSCQRSVSDLESLVDQYQVIKKHRTVGGFAIERTWSDVVLTEHETMIWTTEGGNLDNLKELLQMHANCITSLTEALESKSMSRLERVVAPMAARIDSMYNSSQSLDEQLEEIHRLVQGINIDSHDVEVPPVPAKHPARSPIAEIKDPWNSYHALTSSQLSPVQHQNTTVSLPRVPRLSQSPKTSRSPGPAINIAHTALPIDNKSISRASSPTRARISEFSFGGSSIRHSGSSIASSDAGNSSVGWPSPGQSRDTFHSQHYAASSKNSSSLPRTPEVPEPGQRSDNRHLSLLPPPALGLSAPHDLSRVTSHASTSRFSPYPSLQSDIMKLHRSSTTSSQKTTFEKEAFRNSAVLCDVRGTLVEYSHQINEEDPKDVEMVTASAECRIAVVRKRLTDPETKTVRVVTSIWAFSDDGTVRIELQMNDDQMYIPYASYFSQSKVSITVPCELKFHDVKLGNRLVKVAKTSWVNYVFDTPQAAALFQNELMGRTLLATFRTEKTMRIHEGFSKSFTYAEQMCALENLRIWEDNDTGAIIALIHFSASFRAGYLAFYINSAVNPIKVKDDGNREVKIRGLRVPIDKGDRAMRKDSFVVSSETKAKGKEKSGEPRKKIEKEKVISGAKIEFASDMEKSEFLAMVIEMQKNLIELPDLLGVS